MEVANAKTRASSLIMSHKMVSHEHLNSNGTLFGGYLMCWIDEVAFMCARRFSECSGCVTLRMDNVTFRTPIHLGDHVILSAWVNLVGKTSMQVEVRVEQEDPVNAIIKVTNSAYLTMVKLGPTAKPSPVPRLILETEEDLRKNRESRLRSKVSRRLDQFLERKIEAISS